MPATRKMPKWQPAPEELVSFFSEALSLLPEAQLRKMFGYPAAFINGHMFAGLFQNDFFVRLSEVDRAVLLKKKGAQLFEPMPGRAMQEYVVMPESILNSETQVNQWLRRALDYASTLPPKTAKPRAKKVKK